MVRFNLVCVSDDLHRDTDQPLKAVCLLLGEGSSKDNVKEGLERLLDQLWAKLSFAILGVQANNNDVPELLELATQADPALQTAKFSQEVCNLHLTEQI